MTAEGMLACNRIILLVSPEKLKKEVSKYSSAAASFSSTSSSSEAQAQEVSRLLQKIDGLINDATQKGFGDQKQSLEYYQGALAQNSDGWEIISGKVTDIEKDILAMKPKPVEDGEGSEHEEEEKRGKKEKRKEGAPEHEKEGEQEHEKEGEQEHEKEGEEEDENGEAGIQIVATEGEEVKVDIIHQVIQNKLKEIDAQRQPLDSTYLTGKLSKRFIAEEHFTDRSVEGSEATKLEQVSTSKYILITFSNAYQSLNETTNEGDKNELIRKGFELLRIFGSDKEVQMMGNMVVDSTKAEYEY